MKGGKKIYILNNSADSKDGTFFGKINISHGSDLEEGRQFEHSEGRRFTSGSHYCSHVEWFFSFDTLGKSFRSWNLTEEIERKGDKQNDREAIERK